MINATEAPKPTSSKLLAIPFILAAVLAGATALGLMKFEVVTPVLGSAFGLDGRGAQILVLCVALLQIFAIPFLVRLSLSPLARVTSALFVLLVPVFWMVFALQLQPIMPLAIIGAGMGMVWSAGSYMILNGPKTIRALKFAAKK